MINTKPKIKNLRHSGIAKKVLVKYLLLECGHILVTCEPEIDGYRADVFSVCKKGFSREVEIKLSKGDLMGELKSVRNARLSFFEPYEEYRDHMEKGCKKKDKHWNYIHAIQPNIPNYFSFAINPGLKEVTEEYLKDTPYGIIILYWIEGQGIVPVTHKRANRIHSDPISSDTMSRVTRRLSLHNMTLQEKISKNSNPWRAGK